MAATPLNGHYKLRHKVRGRQGFGGRDGTFTEDVVVASKKYEGFTVASARATLGLSPEQFRGIVGKLASNAKLMAFLANRVTDTAAHGRDLRDAEPWEPLSPVELEQMDQATIEAIPYLPEAEPAK